MQKFKPIYIPIALTGILLIMAMATGFCALKDLVLSSIASYTSARSFLIVFFLLILPLSLFLMMLAGFAYLGIAIGVWVYYGICVLAVRFIRKHFIDEDSADTSGEDPDFPMDGEGDENAN